jgi:hypothetical protein
VARNGQRELQLLNIFCLLMENIKNRIICIILAMIIASKLPITARAYHHFQRSEYACIILKAASRKILNHER